MGFSEEALTTHVTLKGPGVVMASLVLLQQTRPVVGLVTVRIGTLVLLCTPVHGCEWLLILTSEGWPWVALIAWLFLPLLEVCGTQLPTNKKRQTSEDNGVKLQVPIAV